MSKPIILILCGCYYPGYRGGGPIRSIVGLVEHLGNDFQFKIITPNHDFGDATPYPSTTPDQWQTVGNAEVMYLSDKTCHAKKLKQLIKETPHDVMYLNSFHNPLFTIQPLIWRRWGTIPYQPVVLAPRGELSTNALHFKRIKKKCYALMASLLGLTDNIIWQATTLSEHQMISHFLNKNHVRGVTICDAKALRPTLQSGMPAPEKVPGKLSMIFLARIHPIKQLHIALSALKKVKGNVEFNIYGSVDPGEKEYMEKCNTIAAELPENIDARFCGAVDAWKVGDTLGRHHAFIMPTLTENYGHSIAEALTAGCLVVISDQTPWRQLQEKGIGWDINLDDVNGYAQAIQRLVDMNMEDYVTLSNNARAFGEAELHDGDAIRNHVKLFHTAIQTERKK